MNSERESLVMQDVRDVTNSEADSLEPTSQLVNFGFEGIVEEIDPSEKSLYVNMPKKSKIGAKKINPSTAVPSKGDDQGSMLNSYHGLSKTRSELNFVSKSQYSDNNEPL